MPLLLPRRSFLLGFGACLASPAIVKAESLMRLISPKKPTIIMVKEIRINSLLTIDEITRKVIELFKNSNAFLQAAQDAKPLVEIKFQGHEILLSLPPPPESSPWAK